MLKFGWGPGDVAISLMAVGALTAVSFGVLPRLVVPRIGETSAVYVGLFFVARLGYAGYAFSAAAGCSMAGWWCGRSAASADRR